MRLIVFALLVTMCTSAFAFDFDKDDFCVWLGFGEYVIAHGDSIYDMNYESPSSTQAKVVSKIQRPKSIINSYGYVYVDLTSTKVFLVDLNGHIEPTLAGNVSNAWDDSNIGFNFTILAGQTQVNSVHASSEFTENSNDGIVTYKAIYPFYKLDKEKESGEILVNLLPWIPNIKSDPSPYIDFHP